MSIHTRPLEMYTAFESTDLDAFRAYLSGSYCEHRLFQLTRGQHLQAVHDRVPLSAMSVNWLAYGADVEIDIGTFDTFYMLEMPQAGAVEVDGILPEANRQGRAAILSPTVPVRSRWSADCRQLMFKISRSALEQHLANLLGRSGVEPLVFAPCVDLSEDYGRSLRRLCEFIVAQFAEAPGVFALPQVSREMEEALMSALLLGQPSNYYDALHARSTGIGPRHVRRALDHIEQHLKEDITVAELVRVAGVSARALYDGFERFVGMPPHTLIKNMRLERARADLLAAGPGDTVAQVASRWNFMHFGRFSTDYRRRFGERPLDTLKR